MEEDLSDIGEKAKLSLGLLYHHGRVVVERFQAIPGSSMGDQDIFHAYLHDLTNDEELAIGAGFSKDEAIVMLCEDFREAIFNEMKRIDGERSLF